MSVPFGWKTKTLVAALRWDRIDAPMTIDGALDGAAAFLAYVEQVLAPTLSAGETVLMDSVATHKVVGVKEAIEEGRARRLSSALFARLQSDRETVLQDQDDPGAHRGSDGRRAGQGGR